MKFSSINVFLIGLAGSASAFNSPSMAFVQPGVGAFSAGAPLMRTNFPFTASSSQLNTHMDRDFTADSGMTVDQIPHYIKNLTQDNWDETLEMLEPLLVNECRGETCGLFLEDIREKAEQLGKKIPENYAPLHL